MEEEGRVLHPNGRGRTSSAPSCHHLARFSRRDADHVTSRSQARRLQRALEREQRQLRHATMRSDFHEDLAEPEAGHAGEEQEGEELEEAEAAEDVD